MPETAPAADTCTKAAPPAPAKPPSKANKTINKAIVAVNVFIYRKSGGKLLGRMGKLDFLLLTTQGRKTGRQRTTPVGYVYDDGRFVICAAYGGQPVDPAWFLNLRAIPQVIVEIGPERIDALATVVPPGAERDRLWGRLVDTLPIYTRHQSRTNRLLPIVAITPADQSGQGR
jgi:deazaflavin-dependent oxidoreductase (nitroreductase family)